MSDSISPNSSRHPDYGTREETIVQMLREGYSYKEIAEKLNCARSTVSYHAERHHLRNKDLQKSGYRYDWNAIQNYHDEGHSLEECARQFGFSLSTWAQAVKAGKIIPHYGYYRYTLEEVLVANRQVNGPDLKKKMLEAGLLEYKCRECSISKWNGKPLVLQLDHINGDHNDNRIENLRLLCPNCHSQTDTYCSKNRKTVREAKNKSKSIGIRNSDDEQECTLCHKVKPLEEFHVRNDLISGRQKRCKVCIIAQVRERRARARKL
jgi:transposase